ncbi:hypothetical protein GN244_ATG06399 [Phytophthora infestans]|uniref:Uncharacterized protein n=1 Tax=Phytophthora infestans TaxID=4787 RepID=A0A833T7Y0_PHYIN|nr:hypothetical protein GN244_ATG06399 [Phytophthora infestans]KAF4129831.1 hypothetical protein GN958_ATG20997 [Phytophthora infestans]
MLNQLKTVHGERASASLLYGVKRMKDPDKTAEMLKSLQIHQWRSKGVKSDSTFFTAAFEIDIGKAIERDKMIRSK